MGRERTARTNRLVLGAIGAVLLALGVFALGQATSLWFTGSARAPLLDPTESLWVRQHGGVWIAVVVAAVAVAIGCARWAAAQARRDGFRTLRLEADDSAGQTRIAAAVLATAVEAEVGGYSEVRSVSASLAGSPAAPQLRLSVVVTDPSHLGPLRERLESEAIPHLRDALELASLPTYLTLAVR
jgi:hypothetical protein